MLAPTFLETVELRSKIVNFYNPSETFQLTNKSLKIVSVTAIPTYSMDKNYFQLRHGVLTQYIKMIFSYRTCFDSRWYLTCKNIPSKGETLPTGGKPLTAHPLLLFGGSRSCGSDPTKGNTAQSQVSVSFATCVRACDRADSRCKWETQGKWERWKWEQRASAENTVSPSETTT